MIATIKSIEARQFIDTIASNMPEVNKNLIDILCVLEDGEALMRMGATDDDQEAIECAYALVNEWIDAGNEFLGQCQF